MAGGPDNLCWPVGDLWIGEAGIAKLMLDWTYPLLVRSVISIQESLLTMKCPEGGWLGFAQVLRTAASRPPSPYSLCEEALRRTLGVLAPLKAFSLKLKSLLTSTFSLLTSICPEEIGRAHV